MILFEQKTRLYEEREDTPAASGDPDDGSELEGGSDKDADGEAGAIDDDSDGASGGASRKGSRRNPTGSPRVETQLVPSDEDPILKEIRKTRRAALKALKTARAVTRKNKELYADDKNRKVVPDASLESDVSPESGPVKSTGSGSAVSHALGWARRNLGKPTRN
jgi:hypothetical protein